MLLSEYLHWGIKFHLKQSLSVAKDHPEVAIKHTLTVQPL